MCDGRTQLRFENLYGFAFILVLFRGPVGPMYNTIAHCKDLQYICYSAVRDIEVMHIGDI